MYALIAGEDGALPISERTLLYAERQLSQPPPAYFSSTFYNVYSDVVRQQFGVEISQDLTPQRSTDIYKYLVQNM